MLGGRGYQMKKGMTIEERKRYAKKLGVSINEIGTSSGLESEPELDRRILEKESSIREQRLWILAVISAFASVLSALAAWFAVMCKN